MTYHTVNVELIDQIKEITLQLKKDNISVIENLDIYFSHGFRDCNKLCCGFYMRVEGYKNFILDHPRKDKFSFNNNNDSMHELIHKMPENRC